MSLFTKCFQSTTRFSRFFSSTSSAMHDSVNKVILIGRIGNDPMSRQVTGDRTIVNYSLATSETKLDNEGKYVQRTEWHRISSWNENTNKFILEKVTKGSLVYVEGKIRYSQYQNAAGELRNATEIFQTNISLLSPSAKVLEENVETETESGEIPSEAEEIQHA